ncbi:hypothetical protein SDC9_55338 [bioreactor metagenome]|uniref:Uncharacterized protein n=1 Tax=bioreactor metagenome TaxID=1076179 RepID=A0A644WYX0_9ZZZZ
METKPSLIRRNAAKAVAVHKRNGVVFDHFCHYENESVLSNFQLTKMITAFVLHNPNSVRLRVYSEQLCVTGIFQHM